MIVTVDTGGTKTLVASFSAGGKVLESIKFPTPKKEVLYISQLTATITNLSKKDPLEGIIVAMPGIVKSGVAIWCNHLGWENFDVQTLLEKQFPGTPIFVENDANLGGLGEARMLDPVPNSVLYVTISTGIGTGLITNGHIDPGLRLSEGGRSLVEFDGAVREWESFAAGSAIYAAYGKYAKDIHNKRTWLQIADRISRGFLTHIPLIQPEVVIIGGSMGTHFAKYSEQLVGILKEKLPNHIPCPVFINATHPEEAVIYGAYYYALNTLTLKKHL